MRFDYSVVRYVPDSFRGEFINVAVITGSAETCEWRIRRVENAARARGLGTDSSLTAVWKYLDDVESVIADLTDDTAEAAPDVVSIDREWLLKEHKRLRNLVQLSAPTAIVANDLDDAVRKLSDTFIVDPDRQKRNSRSGAIAALRAAYASAHLDQHLVHERARAHIGRQQIEIDFAVGNGQLAQLAHAWSFRAANTQPTVQQIKAWSWTLQDVRDHGGSVQVAGRAEPYTVTRDVPVEVVHDDPQTDNGKRALDEALEVFARLEVTPIRTEDAATVAAHAQSALDHTSR